MSFSPRFHLLGCSCRRLLHYIVYWVFWVYFGNGFPLLARVVPIDLYQKLFCRFSTPQIFSFRISFVDCSFCPYWTSIVQTVC